MTLMHVVGRSVPEPLFRQVLGQLPTGVTVVTAIDDAVPAGLAVGSFFSVSLSPPMAGFCAAKSSTSWAKVRSSGAFCANVLAADQEDLCRRFALSGSDKFAGLDWVTSVGGARLFGALAWIDCEIDTVHDAGDHDICVGRVLDLSMDRVDPALVFHRGGYGPTHVSQA